MADYPKYQFIPNGVFTITNCKNPKVYVNLIGGNASAALAGSENDTGSAKKVCPNSLHLLKRLNGHFVSR